MKESSSAWKWVIIALVILLSAPVLLGILGVLSVTPIRQHREPAGDLGPTVVLLGQQGETAFPGEPEGRARAEGDLGSPASAPSGTPRSPAATESRSPLGGRSTVLSLSPYRASLYVILPALAGLAILASTLIVSVLVARWRKADTAGEEALLNSHEGTERSRWPRVRYVLLGIALWIGLSLFLLLDLWFAVSVYIQFVVIYVAFWVLIGALLLIGRPWREKLLILGLFVIVLASIHYVDWNSRKPFLKDLGRIQEGMTVTDVDQIMAGYDRGPEVDQPPVFDPTGVSNEQAQWGKTWVIYQHTEESWGNSDFGVVGFQDGLVFETRFLPD